eukprot:644511-Pelagomonas_calceolata.AAC.1
MRGHKSRPARRMRADVLEYGWDSFELQAVGSGLSQQEASKLELTNIRVYNATVPEKGHNILKGAPMRWIFLGRKKKR